MRLHRFYISEKIGVKTEITVNSVELVNQIQRVFRLKKGDMVITFDGSGLDFECEIVGLEKEAVALKVIKSEPSRFVPKREVYLYQALVKKDNFEWIVEKATELGVTHIIPVMAERSEKKS
jgi:16S rRNA (uracil1498-N3)-methyltransferase